MVAIAVITLTYLLRPSALPPAQATPLAGGATTVFNRTSRAYEQPAANLSEIAETEHFEGDLAFDAVFVTPPARVNPGLGPHFNNASCGSCHIRNGRGLPEKGQLLARVSLAPDSGDIPDNSKIGSYHLEAVAEAENTPPVPGLGVQIQDQAVYGQPPEATVELTWQENQGQYEDGKAYGLRSPQAKILLNNGDPLPKTMQTSLRTPPPVFGLGLLEAIPVEMIESLADPEDTNGDGISGRPNQVWDVQKQALVLGRFGLKANQPNLLQQSAAAYVNDMGVTNPLFTEGNGQTDIDQKVLKAATVYVQTLGVPGRTLLDDLEIQKGEQLFTAANCATCHVATLKTGQHEQKALANQTIHAYTDLLLHDMGEGLADHRPDFLATGTEWRTPPLWGLGLTQTVLPYSSYLHDGRARSLEEAILWHGGEAQGSQAAFKKMKIGDRQALLKFLNSL
ncbi:MAG: c-type cytochrome [Acaryochloris sp. RU_4_1]|nr:c-type cytochrome [Acaryochloris sp. RU_4_1]NJR56171.1 c-type cytochrome [Acaryochloris sp. CRU_2_0]